MNIFNALSLERSSTFGRACTFSGHVEILGILGVRAIFPLEASPCVYRASTYARSCRAHSSHPRNLLKK